MISSWKKIERRLFWRKAIRSTQTSGYSTFDTLHREIAIIVCFISKGNRLQVLYQHSHVSLAASESGQEFLTAKVFYFKLWHVQYLEIVSKNTHTLMTSLVAAGTQWPCDGPKCWRIWRKFVSTVTEVRIEQAVLSILVTYALHCDASCKFHSMTSQLSSCSKTYVWYLSGMIHMLKLGDVRVSQVPFLPFSLAKTRAKSKNVLGADCLLK